MNAWGDYLLATEILNKLVYAEPENSRGRLLLADAFEQIGYQRESPSVRNSFLAAALELRSGIPTGVAVKAGGPDLILCDRSHVNADVPFRGGSTAKAHGVGQEVRPRRASRHHDLARYPIGGYRDIPSRLDVRSDPHARPRVQWVSPRKVIGQRGEEDGAPHHAGSGIRLGAGSHSSRFLRREHVDLGLGTDRSIPTVGDGIRDVRPATFGVISTRCSKLQGPVRADHR